MLYILGHQGSSSRDADAAANLRRQGRAVREYLSGEKPAAEELDKLCNELAETRFLISISSSVPEYLTDRALMWEATARFLRNGNKDLERTLELLEQLRESKGRTEAKHDTYNAAVICRLLIWLKLPTP
jgi:glutamyl/glutaminyl-tRNA synthetase